MATKANTRRDSGNGGEDRPRRPAPTTPDALTEPTARRGRNLRRIGIAVLVVIVGAGLSGLLEQRTSSVTVQGGGYRLTVTYPSVARPGVDVRFNGLLHFPGGAVAEFMSGFETDHRGLEAIGTDGSARLTNPCGDRS